MTGVEQRSLNNLADALRDSAMHPRPARQPGTRVGGAGKRVAAMMLAATRDDSALLWLAVMRQVTATATAIADAMAVRGEVASAQRVRTAVGEVVTHFPAMSETTDTNGARAATPSRAPSPAMGARPEHLRRPPSPPSTGRGTGR